MPEQSLATEYFLLWQVAEKMHRLLRDLDFDYCGGNCGGTCPLCVARERFAPRRAECRAQNHSS